MSELYYLSQGKMFTASHGKETYLPSEAVEKYRRNIMEIHKKKEWKTSGRGAMFMGVESAEIDERDIYANVESFLLLDQENLLYAANMEHSCGIYIRDPRELEAPDRFVLRRTDMRIFQIDYEPTQKQIIASVNEGGIEKHLALCGLESADCRVITEGESVEIHPSFSRGNPHLAYFCSAGIYYDPKKRTAVFSNYALNTLDLQSGEIEELLNDEAYDYLKPKEDPQGRLYCLRVTKGAVKRKGNSLLDILMVPVRLVKAIFNWLNFFSQRYSGESLTKRTSGPNPAKNQEKSEEEIFVEGNLINVQQAYKENSKLGDKYPGIAPRSWELIARRNDGSFESVKKGLLDYSFDAAGNLIYSNGRYIIRRGADGEEEILTKANVALNIQLCEE